MDCDEISTLKSCFCCCVCIAATSGGGGGRRTNAEYMYAWYLLVPGTWYISSDSSARCSLKPLLSLCCKLLNDELRTTHAYVNNTSSKATSKAGEREEAKETQEESPRLSHKGIVKEGQISNCSMI